MQTLDAEFRNLDLSLSRQMFITFYKFKNKSDSYGDKRVGNANLIYSINHTYNLKQSYFKQLIF